jgi:hypothetical protein
MRLDAGDHPSPSATIPSSRLNSQGCDPDFATFDV